MKKLFTGLFAFFLVMNCVAQNDSVSSLRVDSLSQPHSTDTVLRIINLNPFFSLHVDSSLSYPFQINKNPSDYFWYLKNAPVGIHLNKDNGLLSFRADKSYFLSGRLKYDYNYKVLIGVQNLKDAGERIDTSFNIVFYNTDIIPSRLKPTVSGTIWADEGETISFKMLCETGSFPFENILTLTSIPIGEFTPVHQCDDEFKWMPSYDFVHETDTGKIRSVVISFIGSTKFRMQDTTQIRIIVRNALNYPLAKEQYNQLVREFNTYILQLKYTFLTLDKTIKKNKTARTTFDLTAAGTALGGTVLSTSSNPETKRTGTILPSVGVALTPIKEATAPTKSTEQNQAALLRSSIKRLEYVLQDNTLVGEKDPELQQKMNKLKEELKQSQLQLIDVPLEITNDMSEKQLDKYFNSPKVNKKYRLKR
ncbi:MAG: hypothetical protein ACJ75B_11105 [Flavisolibacter sp.]